MGCAWFSASHRALRLRCVSANGKLRSLEARQASSAHVGMPPGPRGPHRHSPVPSYVKHMQLSCVGKLRRKDSQAVVSQRENTKGYTASNFRWQHLKMIPVHIKISQFGQLAQGAG